MLGKGRDTLYFRKGVLQMSGTVRLDALHPRYHFILNNE